jgi:hypothetical protein
MIRQAGTALFCDYLSVLSLIWRCGKAAGTLKLSCAVPHPAWDSRPARLPAEVRREPPRSTTVWPPARFHAAAKTYDTTKILRNKILHNKILHNATHRTKNPNQPHAHEPPPHTREREEREKETERKRDKRGRERERDREREREREQPSA